MSLGIMADVELSVLFHTIERQMSQDIMADVQVSVLLGHIEWQMSLDKMAQADLTSNMAAVLKDTPNSAQALEKFPVSVFGECQWVGNLL